MTPRHLTLAEAPISPSTLRFTPAVLLLAGLALAPGVHAQSANPAYALLTDQEAHAAAGLLVTPGHVHAALQAGALPLLHQREFPLNCRGGAGLVFEIVGPPADTGTRRLSLTFAASPAAAGPEGQGLQPGTCAWVDRPVNDGEPRQVRQTIRIADSTLRHMVRDSGVYWSFLAHNSDSGHFTGVGYRYWDVAWSAESSGHRPLAPMPVTRTWLPFSGRYLPWLGIGWFAITWAPFTTLVGLWSGWRRLAGLYPDRNAGRVRSFRSSPVVMGMVNYRGGVRLTADEAHLHFSMSAFFRPGHPPFSVPWSDVTVSRDQWPWFPLKGLPFVRISLARYAGRRILVPLMDGRRIVEASTGRLELSEPPEPSPRPAAAVGLDRR